MKASCIGYTKVDYISKKTQKEVKGVQLHITFNEKGTYGLRADTIYIPESWKVELPLTLPCDVRLEYNRFGNLNDVEFLV